MVAGADWVRRQLRMILRCIDSFDGKYASLDRLISDLESLWSVLWTESAPVESSWMDRFHNRWSVLEEIYSITLEAGRQYLTDYECNCVSTSVGELKRQTTQLLEIFPV